MHSIPLHLGKETIDKVPLKTYGEIERSVIKNQDIKEGNYCVISLLLYNQFKEKSMNKQDKVNKY